jgi:spermidine synthase
MLLAAAGALSMLAQVVVLRELVAALYGVELLYVLALGAWLIGTAIGAAAGRILPVTSDRTIAGCALLALLVPAEVVIIRAAGPAAGTVAGAYLPFPLQVVWIVASAVSPAVVCGWLFPALAGLAAGRGQTLGRSYAWESAGAAAGGVAVTLAMGAGASTFQVALAAPGLALAAGLAAASRWPRRLRIGLACCAGLAMLVPAARSAQWDLTLLRRMYPALVDAADTPYARVAVTRHHAQVAVFENGALAFDTEGTSAEAFADLAAVQHPQPQRALVIGGGAEGVPEALERHGIGRIDNLEIDRRAFELVRRETIAARGGAAGSGRAPVRFEEPRRYLDRAEPYDLILIAAGEPASGASSRFYTREFFGRCARRLTTGGVVALRLAAAENVWPAPLVRRTASIVAALRLEFTAVELVPGATLYLFASNGALSTHPGVLADRLRDRGVRPRLITPPYLAYLYTNDRREQVARQLQAAAGRPNRDAAPICYQYAAMLWLATFYPDLAAASRGAPGAGGWAWWVAAGLLAAGGIAWARRGSNRRIVVCLAVIGFTGMALEAALLLRYQIAHGIIYQQVGWLLTCFMAGIAVGANVAGTARGAARREPAPRRGQFIPLAALAAALASFAAIAWLPSAAGLAGTSVLLAATGASVGWAFAAAGRLWRGETRVAASSLYAADVAGGAVGAIAATLVLVPAAGLDRTALIAAALCALLFAVSPRSGPGGR